MITDADHATMRPFVLTPLIYDAMSGPFVYRVVEDHTVVVGELAAEGWFGDQRTNLLEWTERGVTVQVTGDLASTQLLALVPIIRKGTAGEWWTMSQISPTEDQGFGAGGGGSATSVRLGFGVLPDGDQWSVDLDSVALRVDVRASGATDANGTHFSIDLSHGSCGTASNADSTIVVCARPRRTARA